MANQNQSIVAIYNSLCDQQDALSTAIQATTDPKFAATIATEIAEIAHRIVLTQNLLFKQDSPQLTAGLDEIKTASQNLTAAIGAIQDTTGFVTSVSSYLTYVDKAIDLAKTLATLA
jgi:hypothetical protein